jgi:AcrR family transcriptional regulator
MSDTFSAEEAALTEAASRALSAKGDEGVSVAEILTEAGLSTRAFYRHFRSKDELLLAMLRADGERFADELAGRVARASNPTEALETWIDQMLALGYDPRRLRRLQVMSSAEARRAAGYGAERARISAALQEVLAEILRRGFDEGSFPATSPQADARAIHSIVSQLIDDRAFGSPIPNRDEARRHTLDFALRAVGALARQPSQGVP